MKSSVRKILIFGVGVLCVFIILSILNRDKTLSVKAMNNAVAEIVQLDRQLVNPQIDWKIVEQGYSGDLVRLVKDTKRLTENVNLHAKILDALAEGRKGGVDEVQAVILRRSFLRACLFHAEAILMQKSKAEQQLGPNEKIERIEILLKPVLDFAKEEKQGRSEKYLGVMNRSITDWKSRLDQSAAVQLLNVIHGLTADIILNRLEAWKALDKNDKAGRMQAVVYQAEMRQLFHILYPLHDPKVKQEAWRILTEFAKLPLEMNAADIEKSIRQNFKDQLALFD